jgi:hypothetical protein
MDPAGFALESFDVMGGWRDRYRGVDETVPSEKGLSKNGQPFAFHYALPVDSTGVLPDGRRFDGIRDLKQLLLTNERQIALNMAKQLTIYATGAPVRFSDRAKIEHTVDTTQASHYGCAISCTRLCKAISSVTSERRASSPCRSVAPCTPKT